MKCRTYQASLLPTFSLVPGCWAAFKFVQGQSDAGYNPPASPVQHQQHSGRNILPPHLNTKHHQCGTVEPILLFFLSLLLLFFCLFLFSLDYKCTRGQWRGWCYPQTRRRETGKKDSLEAQHALVWVKKRWARKGDKTWKEMSEKSKTKSFFFLPQFHTHARPWREPRLIGSFGLEKWISPPENSFLPNQMTNEPIDLLFTIQSAPMPPRCTRWTL